MTHSRGLILLVVTNIIWGTTYVVAKVALETVPPALLAALRFTLATSLLWAILLWQARSRRHEPSPFVAVQGNDRWRLVGLGLCGVGLGYLLAYWGVSLTTATDAALMIIGEVIFTTVLAALIAGEQVGRWRGLGIALGVVGVLVLVLGSAVEGSGGPQGMWRAIGNLLVLSGIFFEALYTVLGAGMARRIPPLTMIAYAYAGSMLVWLPIILGHLFTGQMPAFNPAAGLSVLYLAIFPSVVCVITWFTVIRATGASLGALSLFVQPVVGTMLGTWLLGDPITVSLVAGALLIFVALYLTTLPAPRPQSVPVDL
jgi:drug/metabolite transporter (DMT)-like permease